MQAGTAFNSGVIGAGLLIVSWAVLGLGSKLLPPPVVPHLWTVVLIGVLPASVVLGAVAGWKGSKWWFWLASLSLLSEVFCLLSVTV